MTPRGASPTIALWVLVAGCLLAGTSSTFIRLSGANAVTAAFLRCALALLAFAPFIVMEWRRYGPPKRRMVVLSLIAGVLLAADYLMYTQSVLDVGAGVATVLIGVQVVALPILTFLFVRERVARRFLIALPVMVAGLALTGGLGSAAGSDSGHQVRGAILGVLAGICYAGFLFFNRPAGAIDPRMLFLPTALATASSAVVLGAVGLGSRTFDFDIGVSGWFWLSLVAILGQALTFVLIAYGLVRLDAGRAAPIMLLQPISAVLVGALVLAERPSLLQLLGIVLTVGAVALATVGPRTIGRRTEPGSAEA
ncbi:DMT family transporter [Microbacterium gorillae]|uniref:DMT family transporter n=1 Tax=Microbacterium gorillae TaxID=1231063 RepID=UPI000694C1A2|nr:DMT family transporter [Microbacterium gorillae]